MRIIRVRFSKTGDAAYISHLDLQRVMHRSLKKAGIPAWYSLGYNPHMYITFPLPLPLGQESCCEAMDFKTEDDALLGEDVVRRLNEVLPVGLRAYAAGEAADGAGGIAAACYRILLPGSEGVRRAIDAYNEAPEALMTKIGKKDGRKTEKQFDLKATLARLDPVSEGDKLKLELTVPAGSQDNLNPALLVRFLQKACPDELSGASVLRTDIRMADGKSFQ